MRSRTKAEIIAGYFGAYRAKDRTMIEELLTDDFTFTSPWDDNIDKATYFAKCWPNCERQRSNVIERIAEDGDAAFVLYKITTMAGDEFRNTELFTFAADRIRHIDVYFGASYRDGVFVKQQ
jgi:ketosteroid isomerase-like protein